MRRRIYIFVVLIMRPKKTNVCKYLQSITASEWRCSRLLCGVSIVLVTETVCRPNGRHFGPQTVCFYWLVRLLYTDFRLQSLCEGDVVVAVAFVKVISVWMFSSRNGNETEMLLQLKAHEIRCHDDVEQHQQQNGTRDTNPIGKRVIMQLTKHTHWHKQLIDSCMVIGWHEVWSTYITWSKFAWNSCILQRYGIKRQIVEIINQT